MMDVLFATPEGLLLWGAGVVAVFLVMAILRELAITRLKRLNLFERLGSPRRILYADGLAFRLAVASCSVPGRTDRYLFRAYAVLWGLSLLVTALTLLLDLIYGK